MMTNRKIVGNRAAPGDVTPLGLGLSHREELTEFFGGPGRPGEAREAYEAAVGLRSTFNDAAERLAASRAASEEANRRRRQLEGRRKKLARGAAGARDADLLALLGLRLEEVERPILTHDDMVTARPTSKGGGGGPGAADERLLALAWHGVSRRVRAVREALSRMTTADVVVLYRVLGPRNLHQEALTYGAKSPLGELSPLAPLTAAAEEAREEVAAEAGLLLEEGATRHVDELGAVRADELETAFWEAAAEEVDARARAYVQRGRARLLREERAAGGLVEERSIREHEERAARADRLAEAWRVAQGRALEAFRADAEGAPARRLGATYAALAAGDRATSAEDAVRRALAPARPGATAEERAQHEARRADFLRRATVDARRLWADASRAYLLARGHAK